MQLPVSAHELWLASEDTMPPIWRRPILSYCIGHWRPGLVWKVKSLMGRTFHGETRPLSWGDLSDARVIMMIMHLESPWVWLPGARTVSGHEEDLQWTDRW
jgi:hypothetical protein